MQKVTITAGKYTELSRTISHVLRHEPWLYELELDDEGWVPIDEVIYSLSQSHTNYQNLDVNDLIQMIARSPKKRHEIRDGSIRALYGHSFPEKLIKELAIPPDVLYHGTDPSVVALIRKNGLLPMHRHYVHMSVDTKTAIEVGKRKSRNPIVLTIKTKEAHYSNIKFYRGNDLVWLADFIPSDFIKYI